MREIDADSDMSKWTNGLLQFGAGNAEAALEQFQALGGTYGTLGSALALYDLGRDEESDAALRVLTEGGENPLQLAVAYAYRDEFDTALDWLERAYEQHNDEVIEIRMYTMLDPAHGNPRWDALLEKIGISDADAAKVGI
jgi:tetratricopeptide (TPR) repeat protein